jgi:hypothetical protein
MSFVNSERPLLNEAIVAYRNQDFKNLQKSLENKDNRIPFEDWLSKRISNDSESTDLYWETRVISHLCDQAARDPHELASHGKEEDLLLAKIIIQADPLPSTSLSGKINDFVNYTMFGKINLVQISNVAAKANLPSTQNVLIKRILQSENLKDDLLKAVESGNLQLVTTLIENGVHPDKNMVSAATKSGHIEVVIKLLEAGAGIDTTFRNGESSLGVLRGIRPANYKALNKIFTERHPRLNNITKEIENRKLVAHAFHFSGSTTVNVKTKKGTNHSYKIPLEGAYSQRWNYVMAKNLGKFQKIHPNLLNVKQLNDFHKILQLAADGASYSDKQILEKILSNEDVIINTGLKGHRTNVLISGDQLIICNRGKLSERPLEVYHFDKSLLTEEMLGRIRDSGKLDEKGYEQLFYKDLPTVLKFNQTDFDQQLEVFSTLMEQYVGNCSWVSLITAVYGWMLLKGVEEMKQNGSSDLNQYLEEKLITYTTWLTFQQISSLDSLMEALNAKNRSIEPDFNLIRKGLLNAHLLPLDEASAARLKVLTDTYIHTLTPYEKQKFQANIVFWKNVGTLATALGVSNEYLFNI